MTRPVDALLKDAAPALLGYFVHRVDSSEDAADLLSETLIAAWRNARRAPLEQQAARMWVFGIARNVLRHHRRSAIRRDALTARLAQAVSMSDFPAEEAADVRAAVAALPDHLGELVRLVHWDGFTIDQAARHLSLNPSTARSRIVRARELLRRELAHAGAAEVRHP